MNYLLFRFWSHVPLDEQERILAEIGRWQGIDHVARFEPDDPTSDYYLVGVVYLANGANVDGLLARLTALAEIEEAEVPASRRLY